VRVRPICQANNVRADILNICPSPGRVIRRVVDPIDCLDAELLCSPVKRIQIPVIIQTSVFATEDVPVFVIADVPAIRGLVVMARQLIGVWRRPAEPSLSVKEFRVKPLECFLNANFAGSSVEECIGIEKIRVVMLVSLFPDRYRCIQLLGHVKRSVGVAVGGDIICE
jgi:hypothetical protein